MVQRGVNVIPKSLTPSRVVENINIFDFKLSDDEMRRFEEIKEHHWLFRFELWVYFVESIVQ